MLIHNVKCVCPKARVMSALVRYIDEKFENWVQHLKWMPSPLQTLKQPAAHTHWAVSNALWSEQRSARLASVITECNICVWPEGYRDLAAQAWPAGSSEHPCSAVMKRLGSEGISAQEKEETNAKPEVLAERSLAVHEHKSTMRVCHFTAHLPRPLVMSTSPLSILPLLPLAEVVLSR